MADTLSEYARELQANIDEQVRQEWGEAVFRRWKTPLLMGALPGASAQATQRGTCGDQMTIYLKLDLDRVTAASFLTDGCGPSVVCGSLAAEMAVGKTPEQLLDITGEAILDTLGGLPQDHEHCAFLAAATVRAAADQYMIGQVKSGRGETASA